MLAARGGKRGSRHAKAGRRGAWSGLVVFIAATPAPADGGPGERPDWLRRVRAAPITGRAVGPGDWAIAGGGFDPGPGAWGGFSARGVTLLAWLPLNALPGDAEGAGACWGYTSPAGCEYAIVSVSNGTGFLDVSDPMRPRSVGFVPGSSTLWHDPRPWRSQGPPSVLGEKFSCAAATVGPWCYAVSDVGGGCGVQVIDLRRIDGGVITHVQNWSAAGLLSSRMVRADAEAQRLYVCGANIANGGLLCLDVSDPENPALAGAWTRVPVRDARPFVPDSGPRAGRRLVACFRDDSAGGAEAIVLDATDPADIRVAAMDAAAAREDWSCADAGGMRLVAAGSRGLRVLDPGGREFAWFDSNPDSDEPEDPGARSVFALPDGTILLTDVLRGLFVLRVDCPADLDGDGNATTLDFLAFHAFLVAADERADLDGDGEVDARDVAAFSGLHAAGCR